MPRGYYIDNPYLKSMLYETASVYSYRGGPELTTPSVPAELTSGEEKSLYLKPFHAARVVELLLTDAKISKWTPVCKDDELMRELIRALLRCEYQFTAAFQKDLFLQDLSAGRKSFCSPLLVNVLLGYACVRRTLSTLEGLIIDLLIRSAIRNFLVALSTGIPII